MSKLEVFEIVLNNFLYKWFISLFVENTFEKTFLTDLGWCKDNWCN